MAEDAVDLDLDDDAVGGCLGLAVALGVAPDASATAPGSSVTTAGPSSVSHRRAVDLADGGSAAGRGARTLRAFRDGANVMTRASPASRPT